MASFREQEITAGDGAQQLGVTSRRFRQLYQSYLQAVARGAQATWVPGKSGGHRSHNIPHDVEALWKKMFQVKPPASFSFAASEALRRFNFKVDRATVRRIVLARNWTVAKMPPGPRAPVKRWQCGKVGTLWQLDVSPHRWFPGDDQHRPLYDMLDDCSRVITGARLYQRETLWGYLDFLPRAFEHYGLPLALYVDFHSIFFTHIPDSLTYLGEALRFYDISFQYASTPQAKGKIERLHQYWQNRLPPLFATEQIKDIEGANALIDQLREHRNSREVHRELGRTPNKAWSQALKERRSHMRPKPKCPWWNYIWSMRVEVKVDPYGTVEAGDQRYRLETCSPKTPLTRCEHRDGSFTFLLKPPRQGKKPIVVLRVETQNKKGNFNAQKRKF